MSRLFKRRKSYLRGFAFLVFLALTLYFVAMPLSNAGDKKKKQVNWIPYASGMNQAKEQNKPVLLFFCADWCTTCIKMEKETFNNIMVVFKATIILGILFTLIQLFIDPFFFTYSESLGYAEVSLYEIRLSSVSARRSMSLTSSASISVKDLLSITAS